MQQLHAAALYEFDVLSVSWTLTVEMIWYLLHFRLIVYGFHKIGNHGHVHLVATLLVIYIGSYLLFRFVEQPCIGLARHWSVGLSPTHQKPLNG